MAESNSAGRTARARKPLVFLVDDEPLLLDLAEAALQDCDYALRKFANADETWKGFRAARRKPDLLVTDYALGRANGLELAERCRRLKPDLKVLMVSGHAAVEEAIMASGAVERFLRKPYPPEMLAAIVQAMLNGTKV